VMAATLVTVPRMAVLIAIVHPALFRSAALPLVCLFVACLAPLAGSARRIEAEPSGHTPELRNPMGLGAAILFGALYAAVTLAVAAARTHFGEAGVYTVGALSGLTELDAITLSTARLTATGDLAAQAGTDVVMIAFLANLVFKGAIATALGPRPFCRNVVIAFGIAFAVGVAAIFVF